MSDDFLAGRIKQNFDLETKCSCQRDCKIAHNFRNCTLGDSQVQKSLRHLRRRCAKLERKLQEKETIIQALREQQQTRLPLLMHETMRSLHSLENIQSSEPAYELPNSHSVISCMAQERSEVDARIHEYEVQIAELYEENQQERLKNEMLKECLCESKRSKSKLIKACKQAKKELQIIKDSGLSQMLMDIEVRCDLMEKEKAQNVDELLAERSVRMERELVLKATTEQVDKLNLEATKWEAIVAKKRRKIRRLRDQICAQQLTIENLKADIEKVDQNLDYSPYLSQDDKLGEIEQLELIPVKLRARVREAEQQLRQLRTENDFLRSQLEFLNKKSLPESNKLSWTAWDTNKLLIQLRYINKRLRALKEMSVLQNQR
ncbi:uncharacterized protein PHALS_03536 [Plasmopara halstedii]|uniref:Uncharacterized protein n=1 Tax=Plasmopara halstedii TaxID=4781 RepID=A0A0P1AZR4_PLAHL|nr:uncharacterized protein PHALS_03536 [Plasmopara halstedii]CEG46861.1 hypothetical protein PHALS_03536 [Plasmopara halstedii]|eukprot:XP_024583230.1 hypothetical protein PHALS_03536 [Plasmopara halstedii]